LLHRRSIRWCVTLLSSVIRLELLAREWTEK
jgi:hypothetical protein